MSVSGEVARVSASALHGRPPAPPDRLGRGGERFLKGPHWPFTGRAVQSPQGWGLSHPGVRSKGDTSTPRQSQGGRRPECRLPVEGQALVQAQGSAEVLLLRIEGVQLGRAGPVLPPLVVPVGRSETVPLVTVTQSLPGRRCPASLGHRTPRGCGALAFLTWQERQKFLFAPQA